MMLARKSKRLLAMLMALVMCLGLVSTSALAIDPGDPVVEEYHFMNRDEMNAYFLSRSSYDSANKLGRYYVERMWLEAEDKQTPEAVGIDAGHDMYNQTAKLENDATCHIQPSEVTAVKVAFAYWYRDGLIWKLQRETLTLAYDEFTEMSYGENFVELYVKGSPSIPDPETATVTFDTNGGSTVDPQEIVVGETAEQPADPTKEGFTFVQWVDAENTPFDFETPITEDITLYAEWKANEPDPGEPLVAQEYHFKDTDVFEQYCLEKLKVTDARNIVVWNIVIYDKNGEHTYLFTGRNPTYDIYNVNADRLSLNSGYIQTDEIDRIEVTLTWTKGLIPMGGTAVFDANAFTYSEVMTPDNLVFNNNYVEVTCNPQTSPVETRTVTLDANGGGFTVGENTVETTSFTVNSGEVLVENDLPTPTHPDGKKFDGWYQDAEGNTPWNFETPITKDGITLYAQWKANDPVEPGEGQAAWFFIRSDGKIPFEDGTTGYLASEYEPQHPGNGETGVNMLTGELYQARQVSVTYEGPASGVTPGELSMFDVVSDAIKSAPSDAAIQAAVPGYNPETQMVLWYVVKNHDGGHQGGCPDWHVDGVICDKDAVYVGLTYDANLPAGVTDNVTVPASVLCPAGSTFIVGEPSTKTISGYTFAGWKDQNDTVYQPDDEITVNENTTLYAQWKANEPVEPTEPNAPTPDALNALLDVVVDCTSNEDHADKTYENLLADSYTVSAVANKACTVTVKAAKYVEDYGNDHTLSGDASKTINLVYDNGWKLEDGSATATVTFTVTCSTAPGTTEPNAPTETDLNALLDVVVDCTTNADHANKIYTTLLENSYTVGTVANSACTVTIQAAPYVADYGNDHTLSGDASKTVNLVYDNGWKLVNSADATVTFTVTCSSGSGTSPSNPPYVPGGDDDDDDDIIVIVNPTPTPSEEPVEIPEETTPLGPTPEPTEEPTDIPEETTPLAPGPDDGSGDKGEGSTDVEITDGETPLGNLPQTGAVAAPVNPAVTMGLMALAFSMAGCGLYFTFGRKKDEEED